MALSTNSIRLALAASAYMVLGTTAASAQGANPPGSISIPPSTVYRERMDTLNKLDVDKNRQEVKKRATTPTAADGRELKLSRKEQQAVQKIEAALAKKDYAKASEAIAAAHAVAESADAKYAVAALQLQLGYGTQNSALQDQAVEAAIAAGVAPAAVLPGLYRHQGIAALQAGDFAKAEGAFAKLVELTPQDADAVVLLAESKNRAKKPSEALPLFQRAVDLKKGANLPVPAEWTRAVEVMTAMVKAQGNRQQ